MKLAITRATLVGVTALALVACEKQITDGKVPAEYVSAAQAYAGKYAGTMEGKSAQFTLSINAGGVAKLTTSNDLVGNGCGTQIGSLIGLDAVNGKFKGARFALSTHCQIEGTSIYLAFKSGGQVNASIVEKSVTSSHYVSDPGDTVCDDHGHCHHVGGGGHWEETTSYDYLQGSFTKL